MLHRRNLPQIRFPICIVLDYRLIVVSAVQQLCLDSSIEFRCCQIGQHQALLDTRKCIVSGMK